jgi:hypothetical protein
MNLHRYISLLTVMLTVSGIASSPPATASDQIVGIQGSVTIQGEGDRDFHPVHIVRILHYGDLIRLGRGAAVEILCANNTAQRIDLAGLYGVGEICPDSQGQRFNTRGRNPDDFLAFLIGRVTYATQIWQANPLLRWNPVAGATRYEVQVIAGDETIWQESVAGTEVRYAGPALEPGETYKLLVTAIDTQGTEQPHTLVLRRLDEIQVAELQRTIAQLDLEEFSEAGKVIALANIYQSVAQPNADPPDGSGLVLEAIPELAAIATNSQTPYVHRLLGDLYLQIGLLDQSARHYQETLNLTTLFADPSEWTAAQVGLANIAGAKGDRTMAGRSLRLARVGYTILGDMERVELVEQWLSRLT